MSDVYLPFSELLLSKYQNISKQYLNIHINFLIKEVCLLITDFQSCVRMSIQNVFNLYYLVFTVYD